MIIGKKTFASVTGYNGLELCISRAGRKVFEVSSESARGCDVILFSLFWYRDILLLENFLRQSGLKRRVKGEGPVLIAGGMQATMTPELVGQMVDYVFVGDGEDHLGAILDDIEAGREPACPHLYRKGMATKPEPAVCELSPFLFLAHGTKKTDTARKAKNKIQQHSRDRQVSSVYRVEIARGCRFRCKFCAIAALKPYRELPFAEIKKLLEQVPDGAACALFAPERGGHSEWLKIQEEVSRKKLRDYGSDVRLENLGQIEKDTAIIGLEGISHKLRLSIGKNFPQADILAKLKAFCTSGSRIRWGGKISIYYIADLPGEAGDDWQEFYSFMRDLSAAQWSRNLTIAPVLNPLSPKPGTPLFSAPTHIARDYPSLWQKILRGGDGASRWGVRTQEYTTWGAWERGIDTLIHRGGASAYALVSALPTRLLAHNIKGIDEQMRTLKKCWKYLTGKTGMRPEEVYRCDYLDPVLPS